jgi:hypothetical protein
MIPAPAWAHLRATPGSEIRWTTSLGLMRDRRTASGKNPRGRLKPAPPASAGVSYLLFTVLNLALLTATGFVNDSAFCR